MSEQIEVRTSMDAVDDLVEKVLQREEDGQGPDVIEMVLSNGAILKLTPPPTMVLQMFRREHPEPVPPMATVTGDGRTWQESNPNDPAYLAALDAHQTETGDALARLMLYTATEIVRLPDGVADYDPKGEWAEELEELTGMTIPETRRLRKIVWMRYKILGAAKDYDKFQDHMMQLSGMSEEDVAAVEASFQSKS